MCTAFLIGIAEGVLATVFIGLNENDKVTGYFAGSFIVGFVLDLIVLDICVALAA